MSKKISFRIQSLLPQIFLRNCAFGTKPNNPAAEDMWGAQFVSRRETLSAANNFTAKPWVTSDSDSHLF